MRECYSCGNSNSYMKNNKYACWHHNKPFEQWLCERCNNKFVTNPKWNPINNKRRNPIYSKKWNPIINRKWNPRRLLLKNKIVMVDHNPRTGHCLKCSNNVFDGSCKQTQIHHMKYHDNDVLKDTIELCAACHRKESLRLQKAFLARSIS